MRPSVSILGFAGSLRKNSYNKALLHAAKDLVPNNANLEIFDLNGIPLFNQDLENIVPHKVKEFRNKIKSADAILIVTPEYNFSIPGVLKNAIDWASRPYTENSFQDKPVAIMSASTGMLGGSRAQYHLRQVLVFLNTHPINKPEVIINYASKKINKEGIVTDETTRNKIKELIDSLIAWTDKLRCK